MYQIILLGQKFSVGKMREKENEKKKHIKKKSINPRYTQCTKSNKYF